MPVPLRLEVFETAELSEGPAVLMPEEIEDLRLSAYERGYIAGYEDASRRAETEAAARQSRVAAAIEQMNFTYHEARAHCLAGLEPLLKTLLASVLPAAAREALIPVVVEELLPIAATRADRTLRLHVPPGRQAEFRMAFEGLVLPPLTLVEDPELDDGQAEFRSDCDESRIDLSGTIARIGSALNAHYHILAKEAQDA